MEAVCQGLERVLVWVASPLTFRQDLAAVELTSGVILEMEQAGVQPSSYSYEVLFHNLVRFNNLFAAGQLLVTMKTKEVPPNSRLYEELITRYGNTWRTDHTVRASKPAEAGDWLVEYRATGLRQSQQFTALRTAEGRRIPSPTPPSLESELDITHFDNVPGEK